MTVYKTKKRRTNLLGLVGSSVGFVLVLTTLIFLIKTVYNYYGSIY